MTPQNSSKFAESGDSTRSQPKHALISGSLTPLAWAANSENVGLVELLVREGADVNIHRAEEAGNTPLREVIGNCSFEVAEKLVKLGADPHIKGWMQLTAFDKARDRAKGSDFEGQLILKLFSSAKH